MADDQEKSTVSLTGPDDPRDTIMGQNTAMVKRMAQHFAVEAAVMGKQFGYQETGSALISALLNYLLSIYTVESVQEVLEATFPNLQQMHDDLEAAYLESVVDKSNPQ